MQKSDLYCTSRTQSKTVVTWNLSIQQVAYFSYIFYSFYSVKNAAYEIISRKGATYYAVALAVRRITESILRDENSILTVSSLLKGHFGLTGVCLSLPSIVNKNGVDRILDIPLSEKETALFRKSGEALKGVIAQLGLA